MPWEFGLVLRSTYRGAAATRSPTWLPRPSRYGDDEEHQHDLADDPEWEFLQLALGRKAAPSLPKSRGEGKARNRS